MSEKELREYLAKLGGAKGGKVSASRLTKAQRIERARKAGKTRATKAKKGGHS
jgi:hypothetical protein